MPNPQTHPDRAASALAATGLAALLLGLVSTGASAQDASEPERVPHHTPLESRLISDSEVEDYLKQIAAILPMATQERDPFGALQDPDAVPKIPLMPDMPAMPEMKTAFEDVVRMINVTMVMPADQKFIIGTRSFGVNDVLTVNYRDQPIRVRVEEVTPTKIRFRNVESDDVATRTLEILPAGMSAGGSRRSIPGLIPTGPDVPIDLD